jgi:type IV pilus biogenesis protein CpaD/CtpE
MKCALLAIVLAMLGGCIGNDSVDVNTGPLDLRIAPPPIFYTPMPHRQRPTREKSA